MENKVIDFDQLNFDEKKQHINSGLMKPYNFNDLSATTLDWVFLFLDYNILLKWFCVCCKLLILIEFLMNLKEKKNGKRNVSNSIC